MNQDEHQPGVTAKELAFTRYFFIDRGTEKDLSVEEARDDFEKYIYAPLRLHVVEDVVDNVVVEAITYAIPEDKSIADLDEVDLDEVDLDAVTHIIGLGFLSAYLDLHKPEGN